jgi:hypothetical protein
MASCSELAGRKRLWSIDDCSGRSSLRSPAFPSQERSTLIGDPRGSFVGKQHFLKSMLLYYKGASILSVAG